jgi:hypothetical protein
MNSGTSAAKEANNGGGFFNANSAHPVREPWPVAADVNRTPLDSPLRSPQSRAAARALPTACSVPTRR